MSDCHAQKQTGESTDVSSDEVVRFLSQVEAYPESTHEVQIIETHISWVFLTSRFAYKLKKPVRFDFLDFSTVAMRKEACQTEVVLNRRLAEDVYLGVVPITLTPQGRMKIDGTGPVVDWVVRMRRLPADRAMDQLIGDDLLTEEDVTRVADRLAEFYVSLPPVSVKAADYRQDIEDHVQGNWEELSDTRHHWPQPPPGATSWLTKIKRAHAAQLRMLRLYPDVFEARAIDGRIVEGHGDLRPEHVYVNSPVKVIDCIEFNRSFRELDVLDELSFFAIETAFLDAPDVGGRILQHYCQTTNDMPPRKLLPFYMSYRATVRAKVCGLRALQLRTEERLAMEEIGATYLDLADRYASEIGPPWLIIVRGLSGTGKSTLARALAENFGIELLQTDAIRRQMFGDDPCRQEIESGVYSEDNRSKVYDRMLQRAGERLAEGLSVVLDGTFLTTKSRQRALHVGRRFSASVAMFETRCPDDIAHQRINNRLQRGGSLSDATPAVWTYQCQQQESNPPHLCSCEVDTTESLPMMLENAFGYLKAAM